MVFKWKEDHTPIFLELFKKYECLWNNKSEAYKRKDVRDYAIESLISDLNFPGVTESDVKAKIKTIRTRYVSELSKIKTSESISAGRDDIYVPKLFWFKQADSFLRGVCTPRRSTGNMCIPKYELTQDLEVDEDTEEISEVDNFEEKDTSIEICSPLERDVTSLENQASHNGISANDATSFEKRSRKRKYSTDFVFDKSAINKLRKIAHEIKENENEFDLFCKSLAVQLKNMPLHCALVCQEKLQSVMTRERLSQIHQAHAPSTYATDYQLN